MTGRDVPMTTTVPKPEGPHTPDPSDSPAHQTGTPPLPLPPLLPQLGAYLLDSLQASCRESGTTLPAAYLVINATNRPMLTPKRLILGANTALHGVMRTCPNWYWRLGPAPKTRAGTYQFPFESNQGHR